MRNSINRIRPRWFFGGLLFAVVAMSLCSIVVDRVYGGMESGRMFANTLFYASTVQFIAALILARPAQAWRVAPRSKDTRGPPAGSDRHEPSDPGYGVDGAKTVEYRVQAVSFAIPGFVMFLLSFLV
jgi:hypothetical protein